jgi:hypothetical protein
MSFAGGRIKLMIFAHSLESFLVDFIGEIGLAFITVYFFLVRLFLFRQFRLFRLFLEDNFGGLEVFLFIGLIHLIKDHLFSKAFLSVVDHLHGELGLEG